MFKSFSEPPWYRINFWKNPSNLKKYNLAALCVHGLSFLGQIVLTILYSTIYSVDFFSVLTTDFLIYDPTKGGFFVNLVSLKNYNPLWVLVWFPLITCLFHSLVITKFFYPRYVYSVVILGMNPLRWVEYSITAGLMTWVIAIQSGVTNVIILTLLIGGNITMNLLGLYHERVNSSKDVISFTDFKQVMKTASFQNNPNYQTDKYTALFEIQKTDWFGVVLGFFEFFKIWLVILLYFFFAVASRASEVPWFVWTTALGLFFMFAQFGILMVAHFVARDWIYKYGSDQEAVKYLSQNLTEQISTKRGLYYLIGNRVTYEISYLLLSLTTKLFLSWIVGIGVITANKGT